MKNVIVLAISSSPTFIIKKVSVLIFISAIMALNYLVSERNHIFGIAQPYFEVLSICYFTSVVHVGLFETFAH